MLKGTDGQVIQKIIEEIAVPLGFKNENKVYSRSIKIQDLDLIFIRK